MKLNWGIGVTIVLIGFMGFILFMVVRATQQNVDLHVEDYYEQELNYQEVINAKQATKSLQSEVAVELTEQEVVFTLPDEHRVLETRGLVILHKPNNSALDYKTAFEEIDGVFEIKKTDLVPGQYQLELKWFVGTQPYFHEQAIYIQP